jgi:hypothetical protein
MNEKNRGLGRGCCFRGKPSSNRKYPWHSHKEECLKMYKDGMTIKQILSHYGFVCNKNLGEQLRRFLKKNGLVVDFRGLSGKNNPSWRGGVYIDPEGYRLISNPVHPFANSAGYVREHRLIMEKHLGRYLTQKEVVHHINGNVQDNRVENLELFESNGKHLAVELAGRCPNWSVEGKERILKSNRRQHSLSPTSNP